MCEGGEPAVDGTWDVTWRIAPRAQETPDPWPQPGGGKWPVSLATSGGALFGPWTRRNPAGGAAADAPCVNLNGGCVHARAACLCTLWGTLVHGRARRFSENPIVSRRPDDAQKFQVVHDALNAESAGFG